MGVDVGLVVTDLHYVDGEQDPDPHLIENLDPDSDPRNPANVQVNSQYHGPCPAVDDFWPAGGACGLWQCEK